MLSLQRIWKKISRGRGLFYTIDGVNFVAITVISPGVVIPLFDIRQLFRQNRPLLLHLTVDALFHRLCPTINCCGCDVCGDISKTINPVSIFI